jgi:hypothetical protein
VPVSIVVVSVSASSMWTLSSPAPERIATVLNVARLKLNVAEPVSTYRVLGEGHADGDPVGGVVADHGERVVGDRGEHRGLGGAGGGDDGDRGEEGDSKHRGIVREPRRHMGRFPELTPASGRALHGGDCQRTRPGPRLG